MDNYRQLQRICEHQAALSASEAKQELRKMAEEYRRMADYQERQFPESPEPKTLT